MLTIPWDLARKEWHGKIIIIQPVCDQDGFVAWRGEIQDSYYIRPSGNKLDFSDLRIRCVPSSTAVTNKFPNVEIPKEKWSLCDKWPRIVISARTTNLYVANDCGKQKGGDLWCMFEISEEYQRMKGPFCRKGWLVIKMGDAGGNILNLARTLKDERLRIF